MVTKFENYSMAEASTEAHGIDGHTKVQTCIVPHDCNVVNRGGTTSPFNSLSLL